MEKFAVLAVDFGGSASERPLARTAIFSGLTTALQPMFGTQPAAGKFLAKDVDAAEFFTARDAWSLCAHCCLLIAFGERPHRARQRRTALCATMGNVLEVAGFRTAVGPCRCDRGDCHAMSAARAGK
jgi:hypothetical protein